MGLRKKKAYTGVTCYNCGHIRPNCPAKPNSRPLRDPKEKLQKDDVLKMISVEELLQMNVPPFQSTITFSLKKKLPTHLSSSSPTFYLAYLPTTQPLTS